MDVLASSCPRKSGTGGAKVSAGLPAPYTSGAHGLTRLQGGLITWRAWPSMAEPSDSVQSQNQVLRK
jgi:hypothetical protein